MTVRVNKSAFNVREKLSELERPIGIKGHELMGAETAQDARDLVSAGRKNMILNGDMMISQRGTSFTVNGSTNPYTLDRWAVRRGDISSLTVTKNSSTGLDSHPNALKVECTANASQAAGTDTWIRYAVEDSDVHHTLNYPNSNKSLSLSFWVRANTAGKYSASITSGDFGDRFIHAFTVNADTWEYKSVTIPPPSQWGVSNGYGLRVYFDLGSGSNYQNSTLNEWIYGGSTYAASGTTRVTGVNGRTFEVTGVQLEVGKNATEFEHRPIGEELALCQRYYYQSPSHYHFLHKNGYYETQLFYFPTTMRSTPSVTVPTPIVRRVDGSSNTSYTGLSINRYTDGFYLSSSTTNNNLFYTFIMSGAITADAEL